MATFRYTNPGTAELLNASGSTLAVDSTKSVTETAFYGGTTQSDCFVTPSGIKEVWLKFDLYFSSSLTQGNRFSFGHYSATLGGYVGVWNGLGKFSAWDSPDKFLVDTQPTNALDTKIKGTVGAINHVLLHMVSGASNGLIELTVNGTTYTRTGNINNGTDFDCLYLYSNNENILFSNIVVSDKEVQAGEGWHVVSFDVERVIKNDAYIKRIAPSLKVWLPFDESTTADKCGNEWTETGTPTVDETNAIRGKALQLNGSNYLAKSGGITLGGQDFTICGWFNTGSTGNWSRIFSLHNDANSNTAINLMRREKGNTFACQYAVGTTEYFSATLNARHHFELDYSHAESTVWVFIDGTLAAISSGTIPKTTFANLFIGRGNFTADDNLTGSVDEFQIYDGIALHTANFTPPTAAFYEELALILGSTVEFTVDVERRISNVVEFTADVERKIINAWRYVNLGTAATLTVEGTTLENLSATKSVTGTAFYQTAREKCFDLPATDEVWLKFDVYFDGTNRWRAYNGGTNGTTGFTAQTTTEASFFSNETNVKQCASGTIAKNQLQTVLLHMVSGSTAGVIEAWVDGTKIHTYTGDVNHGEEFADIYLQSDGAGTFFSNVVISNRQLTQADGYQSFTADVERRISNVVEFTVPVERDLITVIAVPFLIGDHFNYCLESLYCGYDGLIKFQLPKKSKAYLHADGLNGVAVKIYSDTDDTGTVTGDVYAALGECEKVYIKSVVAPQSILDRFMYWLYRKGAAGLDEAIQECSNGLFASKDEVINSFLNDLDNVSNFLENCCGVILDNEDIGAATGSDAGGGYPKNAETIVPEPVSVEDWVVPEKGSWKKIEGLKVIFPSTGHRGNFTDAEKHILAGLNSVWIEQALKLIRKSCGLTFINWSFSAFSTGSINVKFVYEENNRLAYVAVKYRDGRANELTLCVNMYVYEIVDKTSVDGAAHSHVHLDRTLAHEFTHAVMAACIYNFNTLPLFLVEGVAELIHGIDDERKSRIQYIIQSAQRSTLQEIFSTGGTSDDINVYAAGYLFFRYLIKQTIERGNARPSNAYITNLFISDGEVDHYGHALTDNTRQSFSVDVLRELIKTTSFTADVAIFDMIRVEFTVDVMRSIIGKVKLYAGDNSTYFEENPAGEELKPVVIPSQSLTDIGRSPAAPNNTNGLQSVEIEIAEQHVTENVHFVGNVPFDIMYPVRGQYLDYLIDMRIERVQKNGILYSCDCCSDIDALFYTQIAYTVPKSTDWHGTGDTSEEVETATDEFTPATAHAKYLANVLGKTPVIQFAPFNSTVMVDSSGGVTYADLIREIFYWTSRIPTMLINVFIRGDKIYFVQRGYETRLIDLSATKHTIPTVTHDLVRMTWGSTPWSKTETREQKSFNWKPEEYDDSDVYDPDAEETTPQDGDEETWVAVQDVSTGLDWVATTTYQYYPKVKFAVEGSLPKVLGGLLGKVTISKYSWNPDNPSSYTQIIHRYNGHRQKVYTETYVHYSGGKDTPKDTRTVNTSRYTTLPNGEQFLAAESSTSYEGRFVGDYPSEVVDSTSTTHSPGRQGQTHTISMNSDGEVKGEVFGQNTGDDRVTPLSLDKAGSLENGKLTSYRYNGETGEWEKIGEWVEETTTEQRTLNGLSLYDSSFPVHGDSKLIEITEAIKWLNRRTKETVTMTIYEYPHLIDFNDRIIFEGNVYFLVSNMATTTERIFNEQRVTFVRWY